MWWLHKNYQGYSCMEICMIRYHNSCQVSWLLWNTPASIRRPRYTSCSNIYGRPHTLFIPKPLASLLECAFCFSLEISDNSMHNFLCSKSRFLHYQSVHHVSLWGSLCSWHVSPRDPWWFYLVFHHILPLLAFMWASASSLLPCFTPPSTLARRCTSWIYPAMFYTINTGSSSSEASKFPGKKQQQIYILTESLSCTQCTEWWE